MFGKFAESFDSEPRFRRSFPRRTITEEMSYALKTVQARFLMATPGSMELVAASAKEAGILKQNVFLLDGELPGYITIQDLIRIRKSYGESGQVPAFKLPPKKRIKICTDS